MTTLTNEQVEALRPYERQMRTAVEAHWCSPLPLRAVETMLHIWEETTGTRRNYRNGCSTCTLHLVRDIGTLYFASIAAKASEMAVNAKTPAKVSKTPSKKKTSVKSKKTGKK